MLKVNWLVVSSSVARALVFRNEYNLMKAVSTFVKGAAR